MDETYALVDGGGFVWVYNPHADAWVNIAGPADGTPHWELAKAPAWRTFFTGFGSWEAIASHHGITA